VTFVLACGVLFAQGVVSPWRSRRSEAKVDRALDKGQRAGQKADEKRPSRFGRLFERLFEMARKAVAKSAGLGRKTRAKLPF
jgi:hypothetical protein